METQLLGLAVPAHTPLLLEFKPNTKPSCRITSFIPFSQYPVWQEIELLVSSGLEFFPLRSLSSLGIAFCFIVQV